MKKFVQIIFTIGVFLLPALSSAQTPSNLDVLLKEVNESAKEIAVKCDTSKSYFLEFNSPSEYGVFKIHLLAALKNANVKISLTSKKNRIAYAIEKAAVGYGQPFRENFLGDFFVKRTIILSGSFAVPSESGNIDSRNFFFAKRDVVPLESLKKLESYSLKFTQGEIPEPPFFASLYEPLIALGAVIISIYLLFSVRSK